MNKTRSALKAGIKILQLRCKRFDDSSFLDLAHCLRRLTKNFGAAFIVNDRIDIAKLSKADGVHLGQDDLPAAFARKILGKKAIIGKSASTIGQAIVAQDDLVDYIGFGPIFNTKTKKNQSGVGCLPLKQLAEEIKIPVFAIGGIDQKNLDMVLCAGGKRIAVSRAVFSKHNIQKTVKALNLRLSNDTIRFR
ncbi:MAG: thiamine phosphate synthase [Candidatus Omnitrophota bacterium]